MDNKEKTKTNYEINLLKERSESIQQLIDILVEKKNKIDRDILLKQILGKMKNE